jgi:predicted transposase YbfD/YdcC
MNEKQVAKELLKLAGKLKLSKSYVGIAAVKCQDAIRENQRQIDELNREIIHIRSAWKNWNFDWLRKVKIIDRRVAELAKKELEEQEDE